MEQLEQSSSEPPPADWMAEVAELKRRVASLEQALQSPATQSTPPPTPAIPTRKPPSSSEEEEPSGKKPAADEPAVNAPANAPPLPGTRNGQPSALESRIGAQLFNRIGIFAILAGAAWFLKLAIDRSWIGPALRVAAGLASAVALAAWSERFRRHGSLSFSYTLKALAAGIAYLSLWAAFTLYHLVPAAIIFAAMVAVTLAYALLAWRQESELLAALALAGGFATPALLATGSDREAFLFCYLLLLDVGALALVTLRLWPRLAAGAFAGTTAYLGFWWFESYTVAGRALTGVFIALFFAVFTVAPFLALRRSSRAQGRAQAVQGNDRLLVGLPAAVGLCTFVEAWRVLAPIADMSALAWVPAALALIYLPLALFAGRVFWPQHETTEPSPASRLIQVHLSLAIGFFALAGLLEYHGYGIALCWLSELAIVAAASARFPGSALAPVLKNATFAMLLLAFSAVLLLDSYDPQPENATAFLNPHFATCVAALAVFAMVVVLSESIHRTGVSNHALPSRPLSLHGASLLSASAVIAFNLIALLAVSLQIQLFWQQQPPMQRTAHPAAYRHAYVDFTYSAWFLLYGAVLMGAGFWKRSAFLRWQALVLLAFSIGKVFLFDTSHLHEGYRIVSFLGLGVVLLAISFAYQRDWLALKPQRS